MTATRPRAGARQRRRRILAGLISMLLLGTATAIASSAAQAASYTRISGEGSSWAGNALLQWQADVKAQGVTIDYNPNGSSLGRNHFAAGQADFAVSEIPFSGDTADAQDKNPPPFNYSLLPVVAGGTSFMYNLPVNGVNYPSLQLSQAALAGIFSGQITTWNDPAIAATNPGVPLPAQQITVVVRSDGSGATAQFTLWMLRQFPQQYAALCAATSCDPSSATSYYPTNSEKLPNFAPQAGSQAVTGYVANTPYSINYDEYSYALGQGFPVARIQNQSGYFVTPTQTAVAVALLKAKINGDSSSQNYLSQDLSQVYQYGDPRTYPISAYSYLVVPAQTTGNFDTSKGATLGYFSTYSLCQGQQSMGALGYSPLPMNLVLAAMDQVKKIPGVDSSTQSLISSTQTGATSGNGNPCNNPTFKPGDDPAHNILIDSAPFPDGCDAACQAPWLTKAAATNGGTKGNTGGVKGGTKNNTKNNTGGTVTSTSSTGPGTTDPTTGTTDTTGTTGTVDPATGAVTGSGPGTVPGGVTPSAVCDADTGICSTPGAQADTTTTGGTALAASPTVIGAEGAWGGPQLAIAICVLLGLGLVVGPALVSSQLDRRRVATASTRMAGTAPPTGPPADSPGGSAGQP